MVQCLYANQVYCFCICLKLWIKSGFCLYTVNCSTFTQTSCYPQNSDKIPQNPAVMQVTESKTKTQQLFLNKLCAKIPNIIYSNTYEQTYVSLHSSIRQFLCLQCFISKIQFVEQIWQTLRIVKLGKGLNCVHIFSYTFLCYTIS